MIFNRNKVVKGNSIEACSTDEIRACPGLWQASLQDAIRYGGPVAKAAISDMNIRGDRNNVLVDVKIHMLMPGMNPAIPSWHTDGVPREPDGSPTSKGAPNIHAQEFKLPPMYHWQERLSPHRFHMMIIGDSSLTEFVDEPIELDIPEEPTTSLYTMVHKQVEAMAPKTFFVEPCIAYEFDWWNIHRGSFSEKHGWRYFIRVTETDYWKPQKDLRLVLRSQQQVYVRESFGW